jgi:hypothetical protein
VIWPQKTAINLKVTPRAPMSLGEIIALDMKRHITAVLALVLLGAPQIEICRGCCPADETPLSVMAAPSCCGNCEATLQGSQDSALASRAEPSTRLVTSPAVVPTSRVFASGFAFVVARSHVSVASPPLPPARHLRL